MNIEKFKHLKKLGDDLEFYEDKKRQLSCLSSCSIKVYGLEYKEFQKEILLDRNIRNNEIIEEVFMFIQFKLQEQIDSINGQIESL